MKKTVLSGLCLICLFVNSSAQVVWATSKNYQEIKEGVYLVNNESKQLANQKKVAKTLSDTTKKETFQKKTAADRQALPKNEQAAVDAIEAYLNKKVNLKNRSIAGDLIDNAVVDLAFEAGFKRDS